jgi:hypothetical protein
MKNIKSALLALAFVSGIAATLICSTPALADKALEGDQHTAALSQSMDEVSYAWILFTRSLNESRPVEEVAHSTEILADAFDRMCAHLIQFSIWSQTMKPSDFSASGLAQLDRIKTDTAQLKQQLQLSRSLIEKFNSYANDPRVAAAGNRVVDASTTLAKFAPHQDAPSQDPVLNPEALRRLNEAAGAN